MTNGIIVNLVTLYGVRALQHYVTFNGDVKNLNGKGFGIPKC